MVLAPLLSLTTPCLKSVAALIRTRSPLEPSFVMAVWVTCPWEQCSSYLLARRCHGRQLCVRDSRFSLLLVAIDDSLEPQLQLFLSPFLEGQHALTHHFTSQVSTMAHPEGANRYLEVRVQPYQGPPTSTEYFPVLEPGRLYF